MATLTWGRSVPSAQLLADFRASTSGLTLDEARATVAQAQEIFESLYVHLNLKRAMLACDPVQRLKLLAQRLARATAWDEHAFHREMLDIFNSVRDLHTNYLLPEPFASQVAMLPFMLKEYFADDGAHYVVAHVMPDAATGDFVPGAEITHWNGMPIENAIALNADDGAGANDAALHLRGLMTMTTRPLYTSLMPREDWVTITYRAPGASNTSEVRYDWMVFPPDAFPEKVDADNIASKSAMTLGLDVGLEIAHRARQLCFVPESAKRGSLFLSGSATPQAQPAVSTNPRENPTSFPDELEYAVRKTAHGDVAYLGIRSFNVDDADAFRDEVARIVQLLPQNGLIIDVRQNPGGNVNAGEYLLQLFTDRRIEPEPTGFRNTALTERIAGYPDLNDWLRSIQLAVQTGETISQSFPLSEPAACNARGRKYAGKSVLLIDAACYSTTDFFSAGYQDHEIGPVIGTSATTGAGGANVWTYMMLRQVFAALPRADGAALAPLPRGVDMRVALRRSLRVGKNAGIPVEGLGIAADSVHRKTKRDVDSDDADLFDLAAGMLLATPPQPATTPPPATT